VTLAIGVGSVAPVPVLLDSVTVELQGKVLDERLVEIARKKAEHDITPIDDIRSTAQYRRSVTGNLVARFLSELRG
jgi:CO/xanthine dehydrogenase FAD-binding subunit